MSTSLLRPPERPDLPSFDEDRAAPSRRAPLALLLVLSAMLGGGASVGVLAATDALHASASAGVVDIRATGVASATAQPTPFGGTPQPSQSTATGTGFVIDRDGHLVTASHVVDGASAITITFEDGSTRTAKLLGQDDATDVAVLQVDPQTLTLHPLKLASSASLDVGDEVAAIGDPFGYARSISTGIVSGVDRTIEAPNGFTVAHAIQTDAALNPGNSGGPLLDAAGEVVGIADQIATGGSQQSAGVGFAVPIDLVSASLAKLKAGRTVRHAYLGVATSGASASTRGAVLGTVTSGGPAADAGLRAGDVVTRLGDATVTNANDRRRDHAGPPDARSPATRPGHSAGLVVFAPLAGRNYGRLNSSTDVALNAESTSTTTSVPSDLRTWAW